MMGLEIENKIRVGILTSECQRIMAGRAINGSNSNRIVWHPNSIRLHLR